TTIDTFTYTLIDDVAGGASSVATLTVVVTGVNDVPTAVDDTAQVSEDVLLSANGNVLDNDTIVDTADQTVDAVNGEASLVGAVVTGAFGNLVLASDGAYTYTLDNAAAAVQGLAAGETTIDTFTYTLIDDVAGGASSVATLTVVVTGQDDAIFSIADGGVVDEPEASTVMTFVVTRTGDLNVTSTVQFATADLGVGDGFAIAGVDYLGTSGTLTFGPGVSTRTVTVTITSDTELLEPPESFAVNLSNASNATISDAQGIGTIEDWVINLTEVDGTNGFGINGAVTGGVAGKVVSGEFDFNGDGLFDLLIATVWSRVYVVYGTTNSFATTSFDLSTIDGTNGVLLLT
ncbi:MAG: hypothetical protein D6711_12250, partial [Chloroflexi bacterium]